MENSQEVKSLQVRTCQHFLNGEYSVSLFDNGDIMCKFCASEMIVNGEATKHLVMEDAVKMYHHLEKIYGEKAGSHDADYPSNYLLILKRLRVLPPELLRRASQIKAED